MELHKYIIQQNNKEKHLLSVLKENLVKQHGLKKISILGLIINPGKKTTPENILINKAFMGAFFKTIESTAPLSLEFTKKAISVQNGTIFIMDNRNSHLKTKKTVDIIGSFEVLNGIIQKDSFKANKNYLPISEDGLFKLPIEFEEKLIERLLDKN